MIQPLSARPLLHEGKKMAGERLGAAAFRQPVLFAKDEIKILSVASRRGRDLE
jgi:hypothetical protein